VFQAHVCIQQTVIDLLNRDVEVHVVADACSSRSQMDRLFAYEVSTDVAIYHKMYRGNIVITSWVTRHCSGQRRVKDITPLPNTTD
jgi:nicotinamidase-related amidase